MTFLKFSHHDERRLWGRLPKPTQMHIPPDSVARPHLISRVLVPCSVCFQGALHRKPDAETWGPRETLGMG